MSSASRSAFVSFTLAGLTMASGLSLPAIAADHPNLSGFWEPRSGSVHRNGPPSYTEAAREELKKPNKMTNANGIDAADTNCLPTSQPWNLYQSAPIDIAQDKRETTLIYEGRALPWHIYTDGRGHPDMAHYQRTSNGHSIGHWDGDAFVVDSVGFAIRAGHGALMVLPNASMTHVIETFRLDAAGQELHGHFQIIDPKWLTKPYEFDVVWYRDPPDEYAQPETCDARDAGNSHY